jgi:hypothetical protein
MQVKAQALDKPGSTQVKAQALDKPDLMQVQAQAFRGTRLDASTSAGVFAVHLCSRVENRANFV